MPIDTDDAVLDGAPHIRGHRIGVHHIVRAFRDRDVPIPQIAEEAYPHLTEKQVREAIVWALENDEQYSDFEENHRERLAEIESGAATPPEELDA